MAQNASIGYNARKNTDNTWCVMTGTRVVETGFKNRAAAQAWIADKLEAHARNTEKGTK